MIELLVRFHDAIKARYAQHQAPAILESIAAGQISKTELTEVISLRYQVAHFFEDMLRLLLGLISQSELTTEAKIALDRAIRTNLEEEMGLVTEYGGPHSEGRKNLLEALGIDYDLWRRHLGTYKSLGQIHPAAKKFVLAMRSAAIYHPITGVAALLHYEDRIALDGLGDYNLLLQGLGRLYAGERYQTRTGEIRDFVPEPNKDGKRYQEGDAFWHIASHAEHDEHHAQLAIDGLLAIANTEHHRHLVLAGLTAASSACDEFWQEVGKTIAP